MTEEDAGLSLLQQKLDLLRKKQEDFSKEILNYFILSNGKHRKRKY
jgi:hypothetical protein